MQAILKLIDNPLYVLIDSCDNESYINKKRTTHVKLTNIANLTAWIIGVGTMETTQNKT